MNEPNAQRKDLQDRLRLVQNHSDSHVKWDSAMLCPDGYTSKDIERAFAQAQFDTKTKYQQCKITPPRPGFYTESVDALGDADF